jgi:hypothetical protein
MVCDLQMKKGRGRVFLDILETLALPLKKALRSMRKILEARFGLWRAYPSCTSCRATNRR